MGIPATGTNIVLQISKIPTQKIFALELNRASSMFGTFPYVAFLLSLSILRKKSTNNGYFSVKCHQLSVSESRSSQKKIKQVVKSPSVLKPGRISIVGECHPSDCILRKRNVAIKVGACMKYAII